MKSIVIYFSRAAENYFGGEIRYVEKGNTEIIAEKLAAITESDIFHCEQIEPYSDDYKECVKQASADKKADKRPEIKAFDKDASSYDLFYVCYPNYCGTLPMPMFTLLEKLDLSGKVVKPLCTNEGSGMGKSMDDLKKLCPGAIIKEGLSVSGSKVLSSEEALREWIKKG